MPGIELFRNPNQSLWNSDDLIRMRRTALRAARRLPVGSERNQQRQIAASLGTLARRDRLGANVGAERSSRNAWPWHMINTAPYDLLLELAVVDENGTNTILFPCHKTVGGWSDAKSGTQVIVRPTHWREWRRLS